MNVVIIGTGDVASRWHAPAVRRIPDMRLHGVMSQTPGRGEAFAAEHGAGRAYGSVEEVCEDREAELVIVASRDADHLPQSVALLKAGKRVLVEKPMATTLELDELERAARGRTLAVGYHLRFHSAHRMVERAIRQGRIGDIERVRIDFSFIDRPRAWRASADATESAWWSMGALGTHCVDLASWFLGTSDANDAVDWNVSLRHAKYGGRDEEASVGWTHAPTGTRVQIDVSVIERRERVVEIVGSKGTVRFVATLGPHGGGITYWDGIPFPGWPPLAHNPQITPHWPACPYEAQLIHLRESVIAGTGPLVDIRAGTYNLRMLDRIATLAR